MGNQDFRVSSQKISTVAPPENEFPTQKVGRTSLALTSKSKVAAPSFNSSESCRIYCLLSISVLFLCHLSYTQNCPTFFCGRFCSVCWCKMHCNALLLTGVATKWLTWLEQSILVLPTCCTGVRKTRHWHHSRLWLPTSEVNAMQNKLQRSQSAS